MSTIDARTLTTPIVCSLDEIKPVGVEMKTSKATAALRALAERNHGERKRLVDHLIKMTGKRR